MDRFSEQQARIEQQRVEASANYPGLWSGIIEDWNSPEPLDRVWLMYSANYLFRTNQIRWAIDPLTLNWRIRNAPQVDAARDLSRLDFILLTHSHKDHLDLDLLNALRSFPLTWVVPDFILSHVLQTGIPREKIIVPSLLSPFELHGIRIHAFEGLHWERTVGGHLRGLPALGYLIEWNGKRWLFPGDTRTYDPSQLPALGPLDGVFAHLWLGRGSALMKEPPLLDDFCHFVLDLNPHRILLTHLHELGRDATDFWDTSHVRVVRARIKAMAPETEVTHACTGTSVLL